MKFPEEYASVGIPSTPGIPSLEELHILATARQHFNLTRVFCRFRQMVHFKLASEVETELVYDFKQLLGNAISGESNFEPKQNSVFSDSIVVEHHLIEMMQAIQMSIESNSDLKDLGLSNLLDNPSVYNEPTISFNRLPRFCKSEPFSEWEVVSIEAQVKSQSLIPSAKGFVLLQQARQAHNSKTKIRLLDASIQSFEKEFGGITTSSVAAVKQHIRNARALVESSTVTDSNLPELSGATIKTRNNEAYKAINSHFLAPSARDIANRTPYEDKIVSPLYIVSSQNYKLNKGFFYWACALEERATQHSLCGNYEQQIQDLQSATLLLSRHLQNYPSDQIALEKLNYCASFRQCQRNGCKKSFQIQKSKDQVNFVASVSHMFGLPNSL